MQIDNYKIHCFENELYRYSSLQAPKAMVMVPAEIRNSGLYVPTRTRIK